MCKKLKARRRNFSLQGVSLGHLGAVGGWPLVARWPCQIENFQSFGVFLYWFFGVMRKFEMGLAFWENGCTVQHPHFLNLAPTLGRLKSFMELGDFIFFQLKK
jgi:hypothetical protein